jgi:hypothetical protein
MDKKQKENRSLIKMERDRRHMLAARKALENHVAMMRDKSGWDAAHNAVLFDLLKVTSDAYLDSVASVLKEQREEMIASSRRTPKLSDRFDS